MQRAPQSPSLLSPDCPLSKVLTVKLNLNAFHLTSLLHLLRSMLKKILFTLHIQLFLMLLFSNLTWAQHTAAEWNWILNIAPALQRQAPECNHNEFMFQACKTYLALVQYTMIVESGKQLDRELVVAVGKPDTKSSRKFIQLNANTSPFFAELTRLIGKELQRTPIIRKFNDYQLKCDADAIMKWWGITEDDLSSCLSYDESANKWISKQGLSAEQLNNLVSKKFIYVIKGSAPLAVDSFTDTTGNIVFLTFPLWKVPMTPAEFSQGLSAFIQTFVQQYAHEMLGIRTDSVLDLPSLYQDLQNYPLTYFALASRRAFLVEKELLQSLQRNNSIPISFKFSKDVDCKSDLLNLQSILSRIDLGLLYRFQKLSNGLEKASSFFDAYTRWKNKFGWFGDGWDLLALPSDYSTELKATLSDTEKLQLANAKKLPDYLKSNAILCEQLSTPLLDANPNQNLRIGPRPSITGGGD